MTEHMLSHNYGSSNNQLNTDIFLQDLPPNIADPFSWLSTVVKESSHDSIYFYHQHGSDDVSAIYPANEPEPIRRVSKGEHDAAVIRESSMAFVVQHIKIEGHTNPQL